MRYFIEFTYFGKNYHGWQRQPNAISVQQVLEEAFSTLVRKEMVLTAAGRTDAGVHARQMYAHFEGLELSDVEHLVFRLNALLPLDIAVKRIFEVNPEAHARFHAVERSYEYWVITGKNPFYSDFAYEVRNELNVDLMNQAASLLLDYSDFECFSRSNTDVKTFLCDIKRAEWSFENDRLVFTITADRFLRNMVRAVVGTLLQVGLGKWNIDDVKSVINSKDRSKAGPSVPAKGLYLTSVLYPDTIVK